MSRHRFPKGDKRRSPYLPSPGYEAQRTHEAAIQSMAGLSHHGPAVLRASLADRPLGARRGESAAGLSVVWPDAGTCSLATPAPTGVRKRKAARLATPWVEHGPSKGMKQQASRLEDSAKARPNGICIFIQVAQTRKHNCAVS